MSKKVFTENKKLKKIKHDFFFLIHCCCCCSFFFIIQDQWIFLTPECDRQMGHSEVPIPTRIS